MDDILIDDNYDEMKENFFKGLTRRQTVYGSLTVILGAGLYYLFSMILRLPQIAALYLAIACVIPVAANGFLTIYDMTVVNFIKLYVKTKNGQGLIYLSEEADVRESGRITESNFSEKTEERRTGTCKTEKRKTRRGKTEQEDGGGLLFFTDPEGNVHDPSAKSLYGEKGGRT